ncbi:MAG: biotin transporter BioY [Clostridia bacterium]|nr:biotin transporter BioY [Clostridia bacterium]
MKHKKLAFTAITAAILCILSPISLPLGAIPLSLSLFAVCLISCLLPCKQSVIAVIIYILLGAAGLPVFSGFVGGFQQIAGLTGGFIIGYIPCSLIVSLLVGKYGKQKLIYPLSMTLGVTSCYIFGTAWYSLQTGTGFIPSLTVCVLPFIFGDIIKIILASAMSMTIRKRLKKYI